MAPLVNTTCSGFTARPVAMRPRACSTAAAASSPGRCSRLEGLAAWLFHQGAIASSTPGSQGVLA